MSEDSQGGLTFADALSLVLVLVIIQIILRLIPDSPATKPLEDFVHVVVQQPRSVGERGVDHLSFVEVNRSYVLYHDQNVFGNPNLMAKNSFLNASTCQAESWPSQTNTFRAFNAGNDIAAFEAKVAAEYGLFIRTVRRQGYPPLIEMRAALGTKPVTVRIGFGLCTAGAAHTIQVVQHTFGRGGTTCKKNVIRFDHALFKGQAPDPSSIPPRSLRYVIDQLAVEPGANAAASCHKQIAQHHNILAVEITFDGVTAPILGDANGSSLWAASTSCIST